MCWCLEVDILAIRNEIKVFNSELRWLLFDGLRSPEMKTKVKATILKVGTMVNFHQNDTQEKLIMHISLHHRLEMLPSTLKPVSAIFYFFKKWQPFKNYEKCFLFHLKPIFVLDVFSFLQFFPSFPHFPDSK